MARAQPEGKVLLGFAPFFDKAMQAISPPFMKLLVVLAVFVLMALLLTGVTQWALGFVLVVVVALVFGLFAGTLQYLQVLLAYRVQTEETLKKALREEVTERMEERLKARGDRRTGSLDQPQSVRRPLRGTPIGYDRPLEPVAEDDWDTSK